VEKQTGRPVALLDGPPFPTGMSHVFTSFLSLSNGRTAGFNGPNPITYSDMKAWVELTGTPLSPREVGAIKLLDATYIRIMTSDG